MIKKILSVLFLGSVLSFKAQPPLLLWAKSCGGSLSDQGKAIISDAAGNVYVAGAFMGSGDFDPGPGTYSLSSNGASDIFISKFDAAGNMIWTKSMGGNGTDAAYAIGVDGSGNVVTAGVFSGTVDFDPGAGVNNLSGDSVFVSKLDGLGNFLWAYSFGAAKVKSLVVDGNDDVFVAGYFVSTADFDPGPSSATLSSSGMQDGFVSHLDAGGNFVWCKKAGGTGNDVVQAVSVDVAGNVYLSGSFESSMSVDPGLPVLTSAGSKDVFITKLNSSGVFQWAKQFGGAAGSDEAFGMAVDATGNVFTTGNFFGIVDFDPGASSFTLSSTGGNNDADAFVNKLNTSGGLIWARSFGGAGTECGSSISIDVAGNSYAAGYFNQTVDFDPGASTVTMTANGGEDLFINKLNASGLYVWAVAMGGTGNDRIQSVCVDVSGDVLSTGYFVSTVDFDPTVSTSTLNAVGADDIFIHKLIQCTTPPPPTDNTLPAYKNICSGNSATLSVFSSGTVSWYASPTSTAVLGTGLTFFTPTLSAGGYTYYAQATTCTNSATRSAITVSVISCVGIHELSLNKHDLQLYPNPNNGDFVIELEENSAVIIYSSTGQMVYSRKLEKGRNSLSIGDQPTGLYLLEARYGDGISRTKLLIAH